MTQVKDDDRQASRYLEEWLEISDLLAVYAELLPDRMRSMLTAYYNDDMTLSEIADRASVSRQAVHDSLKRGEEHLRRYEEELHLLATRRRLIRLSRRMQQALSEEPTETLETVVEESLRTIDDILEKGSQYGAV